MCALCGAGGAYICRPVASPENAGTLQTAESVRGRVARLRFELARAQDEAAAIERELASLLAARGSRPGDGTDQGILFDPDAQPKLF